MVLTTITGVVGLDVEANVVRVGSDGGSSDGRFASALDAGRAFSAGTGEVKLTNDDWVGFEFLNPVGSGRVCHVLRRFFSSNRFRGRPIRVYFGLNEAALGGAAFSALPLSGSGSAVGELRVARMGSAPSSLGLFGFWVPNGGHVYDIDTVRVVAPGESFSFFVHNESGDDGDCLDVAHVWYETDE